MISTVHLSILERHLEDTVKVFIGNVSCYVVEGIKSIPWKVIAVTVVAQRFNDCFVDGLDFGLIIQHILENSGPNCFLLQLVNLYFFQVHFA